MNLMRRLEKLEREVNRERRYNRPYKYFEPDSGDRIKAWEKLVTDSGFSLNDFTVIILPPRPEKVNWAAVTHYLSVGLSDISLSDKEIEKYITV
jgi:hypothetical protein